MDAGKRLSNFSPLARGSIDSLDCFKNHDYSTLHREDANWRRRQNASMLGEESQTCQFNLKLIQPMRRFTELNKDRK